LINAYDIVYNEFRHPVKFFILDFIDLIMAGKVTDQDFQTEVLDAEGLVLVDFWATWCGPCLMLGPIIDEVSKEMEGKVKVLKLNVDENPQTAQKYQVLSIPTVKLFKGGEIVEDFVGVQPKDTYVQAVEKNS
jgi:thioredoxin 1